eukprot:UN10594
MTFLWLIPQLITGVVYSGTLCIWMTMTKSVLVYYIVIVIFWCIIQSSR